jgi:hypothetical protein
MPDEIDLTVNADGSLIDTGPRSWLVGFVPPVERQKWHWLFHRKHKHCFAIRYESPNTWTLFEPWWSRLLVASVKDDQAILFLYWAQRGDLLSVVESIPGTSSQIRGWMTCAALCAHLLGRPYMVWTPHQLYCRLVKEKGTKRVDAKSYIQEKRSTEP